MSREAMQMALEALEDYVEEYGPHEKDSGAAYAITALRQALETEKQWVGLTDEEQTQAAKSHRGGLYWREFAQAIEAKLKEKNKW